MAESDSTARPLAILTRMEMMMQTSPEEILDAIDSDLPLLLERLEREGDESGIAKGHMVAFQRDCLSGRMVAGARRARLAALYAGKAGDEGRRQRALGWYLTDLIWGTADARTLEREVDQIEQGRSGPFLAGNARHAYDRWRRRVTSGVDSRVRG